MKQNLFIGIIVLYTCIIFLEPSQAYAEIIQYRYDALDRLIETDIKDEGKTQYKYDHGGNLLSITPSNKQLANYSFIGEASSNVAEGWIPYSTKGVTVQYSLLKETKDNFWIDKKEISKELQSEKALQSKEELENNPETQKQETLIGQNSQLEAANKEKIETVNTQFLKEILHDEHNPNENAVFEKEAPEEHQIDEEPDMEKEIHKELEIEEPLIEEPKQKQEVDETDQEKKESVQDDKSGFYLVQQLSAYTDRPGGANVYRDIEIKTDQDYFISGWSRADVLKNAVVQVVVNYYDKNDQFIGHQNILNMLQPSSWKWFDSKVVAPPNAVKARIHLQLLILEANGSGTASFAEISFDPGLTS